MIPTPTARDLLLAAAAARGVTLPAPFVDSLAAVLPDLARAAVDGWGDVCLRVADGRIVHVQRTVGRQVGREGV